jgi:hypothetical protein
LHAFHSRAKSIKTNFLLEKEKKIDEKKEIFVGALRAPLAREPYGLPSQRNRSYTVIKITGQQKSRAKL